MSFQTPSGGYAPNTPPEGLPEFVVPSDHPFESFDVSSHVGALVKIEVRSIETNVPTKLGTKDFAARCRITVLDGPGVGEHVDDALLFQTVLVRVCQSVLDDSRTKGLPPVVLGRLGIGESTTAGHSPPYVLNDPSPSDIAIARGQRPAQPQYAQPPQPNYAQPAPGQPVETTAYPPPQHTPRDPNPYSPPPGQHPYGQSPWPPPPPNPQPSQGEPPF